MTRRDVLKSSLAAGVGLMAAKAAPAAEFKTKLHKAMIDAPNEAALTKLKAAGFEGIETQAWGVAPAEAEKGRAIAEKLGMRIHSVMRGWTNFNAPDKAAVDKDIASVETALLAAQGYGADAILLVPCRTGVGPSPKPWEFEIEFDEKTSHVKRVAAGDNAQYAKYIEAQNQATDMSREAVKRLIPVAEKAKVVIAIENVWNNLWVKPDIAKNFVASFDSPWVKFYYDIGNHVKYAPSEQWIKTLGKLIVKCHVKDFKLNPDGHDGKFVHPRDGSVNWPAVRQALEDVGYNGWMTIEDGGLPLDEFSKRLDQIVAGT
jgi:hexulose-6-phosphate isomerase